MKDLESKIPMGTLNNLRPHVHAYHNVLPLLVQNLNGARRIRDALELSQADQIRGRVCCLGLAGEGAGSVIPSSISQLQRSLTVVQAMSFETHLPPANLRPRNPTWLPIGIHRELAYPSALSE